MGKFISCNARFSEENEEKSKENERLRELGIDIKDDGKEMVHTWGAFSFDLNEVYAFNEVDEYSSAIRMKTGSVHVVDLLHGELLFLMLPKHKRCYYATIERIRYKVNSLKDKVKGLRGKF